MNLTTLTRVSAFALLVSFLSGCLTATKVREILDETNQQMILMNTLPALGTVAGDAEGFTLSSDWENTASKLQAFINEHQNNPNLAEPMRLRLAYLLLSAGKPNLANEVHKQVQKTDAFSERDQILYSKWPFFVWWSEHANGGPNWDASDRNDASVYMTSLFDSANAEGRSVQLKAWLAYTAGRVGFRKAYSELAPETQRESLTEMLPQYYATFSQADWLNLENAVQDNFDESAKAYLPWSLRARFVICDAYALWQEGNHDVAAFPLPSWNETFAPQTHCQ